MKRQKNVCLVLIMTFLLASSIIACKESEMPVLNKFEKKLNLTSESFELDNTEIQQAANIDSLKNYMASLIKVEVSEITYNSNNEMFVLFNTNQISLTDLRTSYENSLLINQQ